MYRLLGLTSNYVTPCQLCHWGISLCHCFSLNSHDQGCSVLVYHKKENLWSVLDLRLSLITWGKTISWICALCEIHSEKVSQNVDPRDSWQLSFSVVFLVLPSPSFVPSFLPSLSSHLSPSLPTSLPLYLPSFLHLFFYHCIFNYVLKGLENLLEKFRSEQAKGRHWIFEKCWESPSK